MNINIPKDLVSFLKSLGFKVRDGQKDVFINCPYHQEKDPSLSIRKKDGIWNCFGCGESGKFADLLAYLGIEFQELESNIDALDVDSFVEEINSSLYYKEKNHTKYLEGFAKKKYPKVFSVFLNEKMYNYMLRRGFNDNTLVEFSVCFTKKKCVDSRKKNEFYNRVLIPVQDGKGNFLWYEGRKINSSKYKKYIRPPFSNVGRYFFNFHRAKNNLRYVVVVEGIFDSMMMTQRGINSIANFGVHMSEYKMNALSCFDTVILCFDGDKAGKGAQRKCYSSIQNRGFEVKQINLMGNKDVCDFNLIEFNENIRFKLQSLLGL